MIVFESIKYKNFLSSGESPVFIPLNKYSSVIVTGTNGNGKSTFLDAIIYCLFGKTYRKIKLGNLVNNINNGGLVVECCFSVMNKQYKIIRGMKPNIFEIYVDGELIPQLASIKDNQFLLENDILKLNYKTFSQIVILGSAGYIPFMQMPLSNRREIIENILDIDIFTRMREVLKSIHTELLSDVSVKSHNLDLLKNSYNIQYGFLSEKRDTIDNKKNRILTIIKDNKKLIEEYSVRLSNLVKTRIECISKIEKFDSLSNVKSLLDCENRNLYSFNETINRNNKVLAFYDNNESCDQCGQTIDGEYKKKKIESLTQEITEFSEKIKDCKSVISHYNIIVDKINKLNGQLAELDSAIKLIEFKLTTYNKNIDNANIELGEIDDSIVSVDDLEKEIKILSDEISLLTKDLKSKNHLLNYYKISNKILKDDGVRTKIIKQYIPIINKSINKYLNALGFNVDFIFDNNFNEKIHSRNYTDFTYFSFSEGEKIRIDLALLFTWRYISSLKSRNVTNLLIFDEIFDGSLDAEGIDLFMNIITNEYEGKNTFVITHKESSNDGKFDAEFKFYKKGHFSRFEETC